MTRPAGAGRWAAAGVLLLDWILAISTPPAGQARESRLAVPPGFAIEVVADGLGAARALAVDPGGALLVSLPDAGRVLALPSAGPAAGRTPTVVAEGLDRPHGLAVRGDALYVAETGRVLRFRYDPARRLATDPAVVVAGLPAGGHHWTRSIAFGPDGRLLVAIGSSCDICRERDPRRAAIVAYAPDGSGERLFASGLRNPVGLAFHPGTGRLWTTVNERDWRGGGAPPDYVTEVPEGASFGWPDCFAERGVFAPDPEFAGHRRCAGLTPPTLELPAHSAPLGLAFYTGRAFPPAYRGNLFVALHGSRPGLPTEGYRVIRVTFAGGRPAGVEDFVTGWRVGDDVRGRPVDVITGADGALYVSDDHGGRIYRVVFR
jgi:glucose/arabinose dehydrogenase